MVNHKNPADRSHLWERPDPEAVEPVAVDAEYPRALHKGTGDGYQSVIVQTPAEEKQAKKDGFVRDVPLTKDQIAAVKAQSRAAADDDTDK